MTHVLSAHGKPIGGAAILPLPLIAARHSQPDFGTTGPYRRTRPFARTPIGLATVLLEHHLLHEATTPGMTPPSPSPTTTGAKRPSCNPARRSTPTRLRSPSCKGVGRGAHRASTHLRPHRKGHRMTRALAGHGWTIGLAAMLALLLIATKLIQPDFGITGLDSLVRAALPFALATVGIAIVITCRPSGVTNAANAADPTPIRPTSGLTEKATA